MKSSATQRQRIRSIITPNTLRVGLGLLSMVAMLFAGTAGEHWN